MNPVTTLPKSLGSQQTIQIPSPSLFRKGEDSGCNGVKVCFLNHDLKESSGAGRFGLNLIGRLCAADRKLKAVVLTSLGCGHPLEEAILFRNGFRLLLALPRIRRVFKSCDIVHALDGWPYGVIAALALVGMKKPFIITAIGTGAIQPLYRWYGWLLRWAYRRADRVVAISRNTRREIQKKVPALAVEVINHAVDAGEFARGGDGELTAEERAVIGTVKPYVLSVGGWKKRKGFEYSFPAFARILKQFPDFHYALCGIGPKPHLTEPLGISSRCHFFKGVRWPFLKALYRNAELFMLLPVDDDKDIEGFGFAFLEAAAAGVPVIGTRESGAEDAVRDGGNGFLVPPRDPRAAARAAARILSDPVLGARFRQGSLEFARLMGWERVIGRYREVYRSLARGGGETGERESG